METRGHANSTPATHYLVVDVETTGGGCQQGSVLQLAAALVAVNADIDMVKSTPCYSRILKPSVPGAFDTMTPAVAAIHGITRARIMSQGVDAKDAF